MKKAEKRQQLVDHYLDFYSVAMAILRDEDEAQDAVQEALVQTLTRPLLKNPCGYCMQTLKTNCLLALRRKRRLVAVEPMMLVADLEHEELLRIVAEKKEELGELQRAVLELHYEDGYTLNEVAGMLQLNLSKLKRILAQAQKELKDKLKDEI